MAAAEGVSVGEVVSITENVQYSRNPYQMEAATMTRGLGDSSVPIAAGTQTVSVSVSVSYKLGPKKVGLGAGGPNGPRFGGGEGTKPTPIKP